MLGFDRARGGILTGDVLAGQIQRPAGKLGGKPAAGRQWKNFVGKPARKLVRTPESGGLSTIISAVTLT